MANWENSKITYGYFDEDEHVCEAVLDGTRIAISYEGDDGVVNYAGEEVAPGHFRLTAPEVEGVASLHRFGEEPLLIGMWREGEEEGFWKIRLWR